jgi:hypothetical protein
MRLHARLKRLEREHRDRPCPVCRDWSNEGRLMTTRAAMVSDGGSVRLVPCDSGWAPPTIRTCPGCGRQPRVLEVVEVLVHSREDVARLREIANAG